MKRFTIVLALLSLPFIAGCMHHGHYYNDHRPYASDGYYGPHRYDNSAYPQYPCAENAAPRLPSVLNRKNI